MNETAKKIRATILAGARSTEHEVSLVSAYNIVKAIDKDKYDVSVIGIDKAGVWRLYAWDNFVVNGDNFSEIKLCDEPISGRLAVRQCSNAFYDVDNGGKAVLETDVIFPAILGNYAEDGTIQGMLRVMDVPFTTADVLGSAAGMDKDVAYRLLRDAGVNVAPFVLIRKGFSVPSFGEVKAKIGTDTIFVKPSNAGSSVGVSRATNQTELDNAIALAFKYDVKVLLQAGIVGRELEISVMGNIGNQKTSTAVGEISQKVSGDFYSYDNKYVHSGNSNLVIPAEVSDELYQKLNQAAVATCEALEVEGFGRVDFFVDETEKVYVNEINTMPGFTNISMYPKLWIASGMSYTDLVDRLLTLAIERHAYRIAPIVTNADDILENAKQAQAKA